MNQQPTVSVIVPTHDRQELLDEALYSVRSQSVTDFECIVVDDCPSSPARLNFEDPRFRIIRHEHNRGIAAARNSGIDAATGRVITFLDDDDVWCPRRLEIGLRQISAGTLTVCGAATIEKPTVPTHHWAVDAESLMDRSAPHLGTATILRSDCPRFDETFVACEDLDWWIRAAGRLSIAQEQHVGWLYRAHSAPRVAHGALARIDGSERLLTLHADYFAARPAAAAFRTIRIGWLHRQLGNRALARSSARRALRLDHSPQTLVRATRLFLGH